MPVKALTPIKLDGLGSRGLNTQGSASTLNPDFLTEANNVVFDFQGRIGPRKGVKAVSKALASPIKSIGEYIKSDRTTEYYAASGASIYKRDTSTTPETLTAQSFSGSPQTITDSNWQWVNFNNEFWGVQAGHKPINYDGTNWYDVEDLGAYAAPGGVTTFNPSCALGNFGRMWYGGITEDPGTLFYSDNLIGEKLTGGAAGSLDLRTVWGSDEIVGLGAIMDKLVIFGKNNIAIYNGASTPSSMALDELIQGVGLAGRDNIVYVSAELLFMSYEGLQSLGRIQAADGKAPLSDISIAVRNSLTYYLSTADLKTVKSVYYQEEGLVITFIPDNLLAYVSDFSNSPQLSIPRVTTWHFSDAPLCGVGTIDGNLIMGLAKNIALYDGYYDVSITDTTSTNGSSGACSTAGGTWDGSKCWSTTNNLYNYTWSTTWMDFNLPTTTKILKEVLFYYSGGRGCSTTLQTFVDYDSAKPLRKVFKLAADDDAALYGASTSLYGTAKFTKKIGPSEYKIPLARTGKVVKFKMITEVVGDFSSLVSATLLTKQGKTR